MSNIEIGFPFDKCKKCLHPVRLVDIHGKTIGRKCWFQIDTMKEWWDKEDCEHFFEPKDEKTSVLSDALKYAKTKRKQHKCKYYHELCSHCLNWASPEDIEADKADDCCSEYEMAAYYCKQDELRKTGKCKYFVDF